MVIPRNNGPIPPPGRFRMTTALRDKKSHLMGEKPLPRHNKYNALIEALDDDTLYTASLIADFAVDKQLFDSTERNRIRLAMAARSNYYLFPQEGDGLCHKPKQPPRVGWLGSRWKIT